MSRLHIPPENDDGCIEYKWSLCNTTKKKLIKLGTQMLWRVFQNNTEEYALYYIGVHDNGNVEGLNKIDFIKTITVLLDCSISVKLGFNILKIVKLAGHKYMAIIQIYRITGITRINKDDSCIYKIPKNTISLFL